MLWAAIFDFRFGLREGDPQLCDKYKNMDLLMASQHIFPSNLQKYNKVNVKIIKRLFHTVMSGTLYEMLTAGIRFITMKWW